MHAILDKHLWNERVLLIFANSLSDENLKEQWRNRQHDQGGYRERDLKLYFVLRDKVLDEAYEKISEIAGTLLRQRFKIHPSEFNLILIDKDGAQKLHCHYPISNLHLFEIIDNTPMRRREME